MDLRSGSSGLAARAEAHAQVQAPPPRTPARALGAAAPVSVVVPTFNGEAWIGETLESVLRQTRPPLQVIVCDDGSTDGTAAVLASFGARVEVLRQHNRGVASARNSAAERARGDLIAFLDHDDLWEPELLATLVPMLEAQPSWGLVYADSWVIDAGGVVHGRRGEHLDYAEGRVHEHLLRANFIPVETTLMRTALFRGMGGFDESLRYLEDYELCLRVARGHPVGRHPAPLARYRVHAHNLSHEIEALLREWVALLERLQVVLAQDSTSARILERELGRRCADLAWRALRRLDLQESDAWLRRAAGREPGLAALRVRLPRHVLGALPEPLARRLLDLLPARKLYGVAVR